jgi:hypothetical protein
MRYFITCGEHNVAGTFYRVSDDDQVEYRNVRGGGWSSIPDQGENVLEFFTRTNSYENRMEDNRYYVEVNENQIRLMDL